MLFDMTSAVLLVVLKVENLDPDLKDLFDEAGISKADLQDKESAAFIYEFLESHGGVEEIKKSKSQPPGGGGGGGGASRPLPTAPSSQAPPMSHHHQPSGPPGRLQFN